MKIQIIEFLTSSFDSNENSFVLCHFKMVNFPNIVLFGKLFINNINNMKEYLDEPFHVECNVDIVDIKGVYNNNINIKPKISKVDDAFYLIPERINRLEDDFTYITFYDLNFMVDKMETERIDSLLREFSQIFIVVNSFSLFDVNI
eukprot:TRINITY_DN7133_c0_g1_i1.p1 TRINITY_DN7133_c0_g1~~TRINITY_DN7133_c0_g1_i1.p1  ORF type:complete len:146 (+),score=31.59 TRINITY_DN7133_c0_g1_i1:73-510(+)